MWDNGLRHRHECGGGQGIARAVHHSHDNQDRNIMRKKVRHSYKCDEGQGSQGRLLVAHAVHDPAGEHAHARRAQNKGTGGETTDGIRCPEALYRVEGHGGYEQVKDQELTKISHPREDKRRRNQLRLSRCRFCRRHILTPNNKKKIPSPRAGHKAAHRRRRK